MSNKLLDFIGKSEIGNTTVSSDAILPGLIIAEATRQSGDKCQVVVKYIDADGCYAVVRDPECHKGTIESIDLLYVYEEDAATNGNIKNAEDELHENEFESITVKAITAALVDLGMAEDDIKKLGNKQEKFNEMKKLQKDLEDKE